MNLQTLRDELRLYLGVDSQELDNPQADLLLWQSFREVDNKFPFREKDARLDFDTIPSEYKYTLPSVFESIQTVSVEVDGEKRTLERATKEWYERSVTLNNCENDSPSHYVRDSGCIIIFPTPSKVYPITIRYNKELADLVSASDVPGIPANWHEILLYGAIWRGFLKLGDHERANQLKAHQVALITSTVPVESKEEFDTHFGGVQVLGRSYKRRR